MSVGAHYDGIEFLAVGQGYSSNRPDVKINAIANAVSPSAQRLADQVLAAGVRVSRHVPTEYE